MTTAPETVVLTPTVGRAVRRGLYWVIAAIALLGLSVVVFAGFGQAVANDPLASDNAAPGGSRALAEVLRQQGVDVIAAASLDAARSALRDPAESTLLVYDPGSYLNEEQLREVRFLAADVVVVDPTFSTLEGVAPSVAQAGYVNEVRRADCPVAAVAGAGTVSGEGSGFRVIGDTHPIVCLGTGDDVYSLVQFDNGGSTLTLVGTTAALTNAAIADDGNAAFALTLLGAHPTLVWYIPTFADLPPQEGVTVDQLTPPWVLPSVWLLALTALAAALWRGRRFGPLIVENLPVLVRASETMVGRSRLYATSNARLRALDALRVGTLQRLAARAGLPRTATVDEVVASVAALTGRPLHEVRELLLDREPGSDRALVELSDGLLRLEADVDAALGRTPQNRTP